jgi:nucleoside-diphosphate-sugar epimerase
MSATKTALITGGCGFVGRHFCKELSDRGFHVVCVDNLMSESARSPSQWPERLKCDVQFENVDCREFFKKSRDQSYDLILHLAAVVGGRCTMENSPMDVAEDLAIDAEFFKWVVSLSNKPEKVVYFSSSAAYPVCWQTTDNPRMLKESYVDFQSSLGVPDLTYGWSKLTGEFLARTAHKNYGLDIVCYRPFSGYGEDQHEVYPFIGILTRVMSEESPVTVWSDSVRDFVHIDDVVDCVLSTMHHVSDGTAINIGSGEGHSFVALAKRMMQLVGRDGDVKIINGKPLGVYYRVSDATLLRDVYGWKPKISLDEGIQRAIRMLKK